MISVSEPLEPVPASRTLPILRYAAAISLSAFLLFQVQPLLANYILPWFGGASSVWTAALLFFQVVLVLGYTYAHALDRFSLPAQARIHLALMAASLILLPITPAESWKPAGASFPVLRILALLTVTVGLPYGLLSTTGPLLQNWFSRESGGIPPYRLFALSNAASLLGLVTYPFLLQPWLGREAQTVAWSLAYVGFVLVTAICAVAILRHRVDHRTAVATPEAAVPLPPRGDRVLWVLLPAVASMLLLGITNDLTTDMAAVPFLWVLPLVLYLATFIICFDRPEWYRRRAVAPWFLLALLANSFITPILVHASWARILILDGGTLFLAAFVCHGELVRLRPHPRHLTRFYLSVSIGGALGGLSVAVVAPLVFRDFWEVPIGLVAAGFLWLTSLYRDPDSRLFRGRDPRAMRWAAIGAGLLVPMLLGAPLIGVWNNTEQVRNFYGVLQIADRHPGTPEAQRLLKHGRTIHGLQYLDPVRRTLPTSYYGPGSGVGLAFEEHPRRRAGESMRAGVIGLGAGTLAAWGRPGDRFRFYEINPAVETLARTRFTYLEESAARVDVVLGDGRLALERDTKDAPGSFDLLVVDAFSGGSIPVHLLTREAFGLFREALRPDGILAVHVSNDYLRLAPVVRGSASGPGWDAVQIPQDPVPERGLEGNLWVLVTGNDAFLADPRIAGAILPWDEAFPPVVWTDRRSSLIEVLR